MRLDAWKFEHHLINSGVITLTELRQISDQFLNLLKSSDESVRLDAWRHTLKLVESEIVRPKQVNSLREFFYDLLKSTIPHDWVNIIAGLVEKKAMEPSDSIKHYDEHLSMYGNDIFTLSAKGNALHQLGSYDEAIKCYDDVLKINPMIVMPLNNKASSLHELGSNDEAIKCYDEVLKINIKSIIAWNGKGNALSYLHR